MQFEIFYLKNAVITYTSFFITKTSQYNMHETKTDGCPCVVMGGEAANHTFDGCRSSGRRMQQVNFPCCCIVIDTEEFLSYLLSVPVPAGQALIRSV